MIFNSVNEAFLYQLKQLRVAPESKPRGKRIKERLGVSFTISNPRDRITNNSVRRMSLAFAFGEFLWYIRGSNQLDIMEYYSKLYPDFSDDKVTVYGAYGARMFGEKNSQWNEIRKKLMKDADSRQAVIAIYQPQDLFSVSLDIPCTCVLQYFIREGKLHSVTYMRSNDIYLGMPYDIFSFTMLQEMLSIECGVQLGSYTHMVGSLHIYEKNFNIFNALDEGVSHIDQVMTNMTKEAISSDQMSLVLQVEQALRKNECTGNMMLVNSYWNRFLEVLQDKNRQTYG